MTVAVVDYGIGNLGSAHKALVHIGAPAVLTSSVAVIERADAVVLPGVGAFGACMRALRDAGLVGPVMAAIADGRPFLGICVGMQMLFEGSDESPAVPGLGAIEGRITKLPATVKLPQIGWNTVERGPQAQMFDGLEAAPWMYFVHTYAVSGCADAVVAGWCDYGVRFACALERDRLWATQFHPEKSGSEGLALLANFAAAAAY